MSHGRKDYAEPVLYGADFRDSGCTLLGLRLFLRLSDPGADGFAAAGGINRLRL